MIRRFKADDLEIYLALSRDFYASEATDHPVSEGHFHHTFSECISDSPMARGWMIEDEKGRPVGYFLASLTWSNEFGGRIAWLEELWLAENARGSGLGRRVFEAVTHELAEKDKVLGFRLEVAPANAGVTALYKKMGFTPVPYTQWWTTVN
ncbi:GNAT family N-acetyltransferase [Deltaproteobacteria bacterium OttesenSCG-928-M10]|nr:GNAT family N-acetyltransferase [Deltaproteobacteria bacterium OttesenSCG-928-M10]